MNDIISLVQRLSPNDIVSVPFDLFHNSLYRAQIRATPEGLIPIVGKSGKHARPARTRVHFRIRLHAENAIRLQPFELPLLKNIVDQKLLTPDQGGKFQVAFDEALTNAIDHGCLELDSKLRSIVLDDGRSEFDRLRALRLRDSRYGKRCIWISFTISDGNFTCKIRDSGPGFDRARQAANPPDIESVSGRGLMLMRRFADIVTYNKQNNQVTLVKFLKHRLPVGGKKNGITI